MPVFHLPLPHIAASLAMGLVFGSFSQASGLFEPTVIRAQFVFEREIMMKVFLAAAGMSSLVLATFFSLFPSDFAKARGARGWGDKGAVTSILGGLVQGVGMALSGACPGLILVQMGTGVTSSYVGFAGGLLGALVYGLVHPFIERHHIEDFKLTFAEKFASVDLEHIFKVRYVVAATTLGLGLIGGAMALDRFFDWRSDLVGLEGIVGSHNSLHPVVAGMGIGALQIPAFLALGTFLGSSTAYSVASGQWLLLLDTAHPWRFTLKYMNSMVSTKGAWQVTYAVGAMAGAYLAWQNVGSFHAVRGVPATEAFLGGFLMVFGARFAGGCTSGHGISGLSALSVPSWFVVPFMFGGAITFSFAMSALQGRDVFLLKNSN